MKNAHLRVLSPNDLARGDGSALILDEFLTYVKAIGFELYPAQEEAILALWNREHVILNTPTGSGKSLVAEAFAYYSICLGQKLFYTCPIKALVNEKFFNLAKVFGAENVGLMTGDGAVNEAAPIICCTAEILANLSLRQGEDLQVQHVVVDEFHYYGDRERGVYWQLPLLTLKNTQFLLMSATLGDLTDIRESLERLSRRTIAHVSSLSRPVPLEYSYREDQHLFETIAELVRENKAPIYLVNFSQRQASEQAQNLLSRDFLTKEDKALIAGELKGYDFRSPFGKELSRWLKHGIGVHHAGLLPRYRLLVEKLTQKGLLKVISGTDTLGVGVNVPIRTVLLSQLCKYDGAKTAILSARDFHQVAGRAGRRGFDQIGYVVAQAPEHIIENRKLERKASADPKKAKKIVKAKPPQQGFVLWDAKTFEKLQTSAPEKLVSRFRVDHGIVLNLLSRKDGSGCESLRELIRESHESAASKKKLRRESFQIFRSLVERKIITLNPTRVHVDLQDDFSIHQALGLWLIDVLPHLDTADPEWLLNVISLCESICESPDVVLRKQRDRARDELFQQLKMEGVEFEERQERLEAVEHPKPMRDFIYDHFNSWTDRHPWIGNDNIQPKSIVREIFESGMTFFEYIREYDLRRSEGVLLRYINEVYKVLAQTVPLQLKGLSDQNSGLSLNELEAELQTLIRSVDSSLLEEWMQLAGQTGPKASGEVRLRAHANTTQIDKPATELAWKSFGYQLVKDYFDLEIPFEEQYFELYQKRGIHEFEILIGGRELLWVNQNPSDADLLEQEKKRKEEVFNLAQSGLRAKTELASRKKNDFKFKWEPGRLELELGVRLENPQSDPEDLHSDILIVRLRGNPDDFVIKSASSS